MKIETGLEKKKVIETILFSGTTQSREMLVVVFASQLYKVIDEF